MAGRGGGGGYGGVMQRMRREVCTFRFWKAVRAEFLGSLLLLFLGCGVTLGAGRGCVPPPQLPQLQQQVLADDGAGDIAGGGSSSSDELTVALGFGLAIGVVTLCTVQSSGAHLNPALSLAMLAAGRVTPARALFYSLAQVVGGLSGSGLLLGVARQRLNASSVAVNYFVPTVAPDLGAAQAFGVEFMCTFVYAFAAFACWDPRRPVDNLGGRSLAVGLSVAVGHLVALRLSGAALNPVRALGPALVTGSWSHHWVYWAGPLLGAAAGGLTCEYAQDSRSELHYLRRSLTRRGGARRERGGGGGGGGDSGGGDVREFTFTPSTTFENIGSA